MNYWEVKNNDVVHLNNDEVHIWRVNISEAENYLFKYKQILDEIELNKFRKFYKKIDVIRSIVGRALIRILSAKYLDLKTSQVLFAYSKYHKPFLSENINVKNLKFNISHAGNWIALAFCLEHEIGVDIEEFNNDFDMAGSAKLVFSLCEYNAWLSLSSIDKCASFFHVWSCKEAIIKALGLGFYYPPENITVSIDPQKSCEVIEDKNSDYPVWDWTLEKFYIDANYSAAIATKKKNFIIKYFEWNDFK
ncbi:4'-phosphopantetheinyl transferase family protein [Fluviispira sanaruensis]|uniref:4'-phosphopantetheinyl transferase n=1 Tax=Fluviispira sanaruensis TaxID=2493639 RepID=A0A4P2VXT7_FLUSA|nr:4'-phosphopantetheinyl transferase superfamily protein [Fluviispira sanaruensis]BBH54455.1 4'-phosphopantetheinyl transferase [Fluviispira sanaruensis]